MAKWLRRAYGLRNLFPATEPYTSKSHFRAKLQILAKHVSWRDWIVQVDADEFLVFPGEQTAPETLHALDLAGANIHYGLMVDRLARDGSLSQLEGSPFEQYPSVCAVTLLLQEADVRKVCAYRGYLRTTTGNHNAIGLNRSSGPARAHVAALREAMGQQVLRLVPGAHAGRLYHVRPTPRFATLHHFKWTQGLGAKLQRRWQTEDYTRGQYEQVLKVFSSGGLGGLGQRLCSRDLAAVSGALSPRELLLLFLNVKPAALDAMAGSEPEAFFSRLLDQTMNHGIARESYLFSIR